jgi:hypothetical protein
MQIKIESDEQGNIKKIITHNNKAPGLLRIAVVGDYRKTKAKSTTMVDVKNSNEIKQIATRVLDKPVESLKFRFNANLSAMGHGILVQDATQKYQPANSPTVFVKLFDDGQDIDAAIAAEIFPTLEETPAEAAIVTPPAEIVPALEETPAEVVTTPINAVEDAKIDEEVL